MRHKNIAEELEGLSAVAIKHGKKLEFAELSKEQQDHVKAELSKNRYRIAQIRAEGVSDEN